MATTRTDITNKPCSALRKQGIRYATSKKGIVFCTTNCPHPLCLIVDLDPEDEGQDMYYILKGLCD